MELIIENVRSFFGSHTIPVRPLTILVGENSSGKSTFLGVLAAVLSRSFPAMNYALNVPPYDFGSYDTIASNRGGRYGRSKSFSLGYSTGKPGEATFKYLKATYAEHHGQPKLRGLEGKTSSIRASFDIETNQVTVKLEFVKKDQEPLTYSFSAPFSPESMMQPQILFQVTVVKLMELVRPGAGQGSHQQKTANDLINELAKLFINQLVPPEIPMPPEEMASPLLPVSLSLAPVRTKPRRTYDELSDVFRPEGDHIPLILARIWEDENIDTKKVLQSALVEFGKEAGLFQDLRVKKIGQRLTIPFRIMVKTAGPAANLPDVGYGVSQSLPIVVESVLSGKNKCLLVQQPEVHLHPRAQAALGSFLAKLVAKDRKQFVVETHSDFLVDRIRQEVAKGTLTPEAVLILFFDKPSMRTKVYPIRLDKQGNVLDAPKSYRKFYLSEERNLLYRA